MFCQVSDMSDDLYCTIVIRLMPLVLLEGRPPVLVRANPATMQSAIFNVGVNAVVVRNNAAEIADTFIYDRPGR